MKKKEKVDNNSYFIGYECGKKQVIEKILSFVDKESQFLPDIHIDKLLDRIVNFIKKI